MSFILGQQSLLEETLPCPTVPQCSPSSLYVPPLTSPSPTSVVIMSSSTCNDNQKLPSNISSRSYILQVGVSAGRLCGVANSHLLDVSKAANDHMALILAMTDLLIDLWRTSQSLQLNLVVAIHKKLALNKKKYPVEHCKVRTNRIHSYCKLCKVDYL